MALPRGDEYNQAVQNPTISFADSELKSCQVETTPLGLPKPYSGGFTTTYKLRGSSRNWAVRCFTREIKDLQQRYQSIGNFLSQNNCSFLVDAKYLQSGIRISGTYHPIIKMNWLDGEPLNAYIDRIYNQKSSLESLLNEFTNLVKQLENFGIAHGDLQHGNIMVKNGKLFLIDYDGMYLPDLANLSVNELGHPNFQHPRRAGKDYNKYIDRFSAIIIYTAIKAIIVNPNLWRKYENGDNLLFKGSDFANPGSSALLKDIVGYSELARLANNIAAICTLEFGKIPSLQEFLNGTIASSTQILPQVTTVRSAYLVLDGSQRGKLLEHIGERVEVIGRIGGHKRGTTRNGDPYLFINFGSFPQHTFTIVLWSDILLLLQRSGIEPTNLIGKYVSITGVLNVYHSEYMGVVTPRPQIAIDIPSQFQILAGENEAQAKLNYRTVTAVPKVQPAAPKQPVKEEDFWDSYLKNRPVTPTPKPTIQPPRVVIPPATVTTTPRANTTSNTNTNKTTTPSSNSSTSKKDSGCTTIIVVGIIGAVILGGLTGNGGGAIFGFMIGGWIGSQFSN
jgi:hypothetical protein